MNDDQKKELIRFLDFHGRTKSTTAKPTQAVISNQDLTSAITTSFELLNRDYTVLHYSQNTETRSFLEELAWALFQGKAVLIVSDTLSFEPILYDQLVQIRLNHRFTVDFGDDSLNRTTISPSAAIFIFYKGSGSSVEEKLAELADYILKIEEPN